MKSMKRMKGILPLIKEILSLIAIIATRVAGFLSLIAIIATRIAGFLSLRKVMNRTLVLIIIIAVCVAGFLSIRGVMPFMAIFGSSMEPELQAGNLILVEEVAPSDVEVDDIIVFTIPSAVREYYNYPPVVAHRVIQVRTSEIGITFRTKGDNTGEDPFTVRPQDLLGQVSDQIPYLGFPLLFFQSQQGLIFIGVALLLLTLFLYADELNRGRRGLQRGIFAPVIEENQHASRVLDQRMETTERVLDKFTSAIEVYAQHLESHTTAIQGLSEASQELKKGAAEQNRVLARLLGSTEQPSPEKIEEPAPEVEETQFPPGCVRSHQKDTKEDKTSEAG